MYVRLTNSAPEAGASIAMKRRELLKRTRGLTLEVNAVSSAKRVHAPTTATPTSSSSSTTSSSSSSRTSTNQSCLRFEDIEVPQEELLSAHDDYERLCDILSVA